MRKLSLSHKEAIARGLRRANEMGRRKGNYRLGISQPSQVRDKIRQSLNGHKHSPETLAKLRGRKRSVEVRLRISAATKGRVPWNKGRQETRPDIIAKYIKANRPHDWVAGSESYRRQLRLKKNGGIHSQGEWENLKAQYNWTCPSCKKREPEIRLTRDHIVSLANGGSDNIENIQPLCRPCNSKKHKKTIRY